MTAQTETIFPQEYSERVPLALDLDGALVRTDLFAEAILALLGKNLLYVFLLPFWLLRGKAYVKSQVALRVGIDPAFLPYNENVLGYIIAQRRIGRRVLLVTGSNERYARSVAGSLGCFDDFFASDGQRNLSGYRKADELISRFGERGFDYVGNSRADLPVWTFARQAYVVGGKRLQDAARRVSIVGGVFPNGRGGLQSYVRALRPQQWVKNLLVFVPLLAGHRIADLTLLGQAMIAFVAFSLCASSVYLVNDLVDLPADRRHPHKRSRPFAAGQVCIWRGIAAVPILLSAAFGLTVLLPTSFARVLVIYYLATVAYSFSLKRVLMLDVITLGLLYTLRVIGGGAATGITPSFWLLSFSMFIFLSLALVKRFSELLLIRGEGQDTPMGRAYKTIDLETLFTSGIASGFMSVLVLALYINSEEVRTMYRTPEAIWLLCPLLLYWLSSLWVRARRGMIHDDPLVFAIGDHVSRWVLLLMITVVLCASLLTM